MPRLGNIKLFHLLLSRRGWPHDGFCHGVIPFEELSGKFAYRNDCFCILVQMSVPSLSNSLRLSRSQFGRNKVRAHQTENVSTAGVEDAALGQKDSDAQQVSNFAASRLFTFGYFDGEDARLPQPMIFVKWIALKSFNVICTSCSKCSASSQRARR